MNRASHTLFAVASLGAAVTAQQHLVVPAAYTNSEAPAYGWIAGASRNVRQQTLIGASHLTALVNQQITAIELRRHAANEAYLPGVGNMTVTLSIAPHPPLDVSSTYAANAGVPAVQVFSGQVSFPASPANPGPVAWTPANVVRIPFTTPFVYAGGTLCVDIVGTAVPGQEANWWMADLELEDIGGSFVDLGGGCGVYGGVDKDWASVSRRSLLPGAHARFSAYGTPFGLAIAAFGNRAPAGVPFAALGFPALPTCELHLSTLDGLMPMLFMPPAEPSDITFGGEAELSIKLPASSSMYGLSLTTQWIDWAQMATSNAIEWTIASVMPTLDMAHVDGDPTEAFGLSSVHLAHVLRFEYQ